MTQSHIRNFAIIAHIDHGKSTLSDRLLELTGTIAKDKLHEQFLDQNPISRERGITIKLAPVRMVWRPSNSKLKIQSSGSTTSDLTSTPLLKGEDDKDQNFVLNLIDTPGHVDFSYEVSRTLAACEGAVLLVDATQGVQAQTVAHLREAQKQDLVIIPVINKIDMPAAQPDRVAQEITDLFGFKKEEMLFVSAKTGQHVEELLNRVIEKIPPPQGKQDAPLRALIFDAVYDEHRGVVAEVKIVDGKISKNDTMTLFQNNVSAQVTEVGYFSPFLTPSQTLETGEIGYIVTGIKDIRQVQIGDTVTNSEFKIQNSNLEPLPGYKPPQPMVFFGVYPKEKAELPKLKEALVKLILTDSSLTIAEEYSAFLGAGFRVGFLGMLHAEIVKERLNAEFGIDPLLTMPHVLYRNQELRIKNQGNGDKQSHSISEGQLEEPYMLLTIYTPEQYVGNIITLAQKRKGELLDMQYHGKNVIMSYEMPYSMFIRGLSADLKAASAGYASFDYELVGYKPADLLTLEIKINDEPIDVLTERVYKEEAEYMARRKTEKLKETLDRQQFRQIIQGVINGRIVAREEIPPFRKDVLAKMSGGDRTRKDKLLEAQKKGKSRLKTHGRVEISQDALLSMIKG